MTMKFGYHQHDQPIDHWSSMESGGGIWESEGSVRIFWSFSYIKIENINLLKNNFIFFMEF